MNGENKHTLCNSSRKSYLFLCRLVETFSHHWKSSPGEKTKTREAELKNANVNVWAQHHVWGCDDYFESRRFVTAYLPISQISEKLDSKLSFHWIPVPSYPESGRKTHFLFQHNMTSCAVVLNPAPEQTFIFVHRLIDLAFQYAVFMHLLMVLSD